MAGLGFDHGSIGCQSLHFFLFLSRACKGTERLSRARQLHGGNRAVMSGVLGGLSALRPGVGRGKPVSLDLHSESLGFS